MCRTPRLTRRAVLAVGAGFASQTVTARDRLVTLEEWMHASLRERASAWRSRLKRIEVDDSAIHAWVQLLPQGATGAGKLSEIPFGVKDIIETRGLVTEYGSPVYKGRTGTFDADIVREFRDHGGILAGKTETAAFAMRDPAPTRNPRNLAHSPGGSSSGSAAAIAADMVPVTIGTQTAGSIIRPASYCGITGFKPSFGLFPMNGVLPYAPSLDTIGFFTHRPTDMLMLWEGLERSNAAEDRFVIGVPDPMPESEPEMATAMQSALRVLRQANVNSRPINIAPMLATLAEAQRTIMYFEGSRVHESRVKQYGIRLGYMADMVFKGLQIPIAEYDRAKNYVENCKSRIAQIYESIAIIVVPAATGPAPLGIESTGDSRMNSPWTALGTPAVSIPLPVRGLPLGLQLTAAHRDDARLLRAAVRIHRILYQQQRSS